MVRLAVGEPEPARGAKPAARGVKPISQARKRSTPDGTNRPGTVTLEKIVSASGKLFAERGYYNTTMEDIAAEVGILKGSLYHHVGSKEAILDRILLNTVSGPLAALQEISDGGIPAEDRFDLMLRAMLRNTTEHARDGTTVYATEHHRLPSGLQHKYRAVLKQQRRLFEATVKDLMAEGRASLDGEDIDIAVTTIIGLTTMTSLWYRPTGRLTLAQIEDQVIRHARRMIGLTPVAASSARVVCGRRKVTSAQPVG